LALVGSGASVCGGCVRGAGYLDLARSSDGGDAAIGGPACHTDWPMPNPPSSGLPNPQSYDAGISGVVLDRVTGLSWQQVVDPNSYTKSSANAYCGALMLAGYGDWRLPSVLELMSIVDMTQVSPAIDAVAFPNTPPLPFWSSQNEVGNSGLGWYVYFKNGGAYGGNDVSDPQRVRCVRGPIPPADDGSNCFVVANGAAYDIHTKLMWQQAIDPSSYAWMDAQSYCATLGSSATGWRLPSVEELLTLVDLTRVDPAIDTTVFPGTGSDFFWSSSADVGSPGTAWGVSFNSGSAGASPVANASRVRCVR
jgi:hypothetical protein